MGHDLTRMLRAGIPADWTTSERLIALVLADACSDKTHAGYISNAQLCQETGMGVRTVRRTLASLALRGYEFRVVLTVGSDGRPVYANRGRATDYRVPILPPRPAKEVKTDRLNDEKEVKTDRLNDEKEVKTDRLTDEKGGQFWSEGGQFWSERRSRLSPPTTSNPPTTKRSEPSVVTPTGGRPLAGVGGATRQPIEQAAWAAIQRRDRMLCATTTRTPMTSGTTT